jgi:hypothetical protein
LRVDAGRCKPASSHRELTAAIASQHQPITSWQQLVQADISPLQADIGLRKPTAAHCEPTSVRLSRHHPITN